MNKIRRQAEDIWEQIGVTDYAPPVLTKEGLSEKTVYVVDINAIVDANPAMNHDIWRMVVSLQGVINRSFQEHHLALYIFFADGRNEDAFWLDFMQREGKFLQGYQRVEINSLSGFLEIFDVQLKEAGLVLWDEKVPATSNVAATACGLYNWIPVRYDLSVDSLYSLLVGRGVPVKESYVGLFTGIGHIPGTEFPSTGSAKNDAYYWAADQYMDKTAPDVLAYYADGACCIPGHRCFTDDNGKLGGHFCSIPNHDYFIARRAFFFDLSPADDEPPCDDLNQPLGTDTNTYRKIMRAQYQRNQGEIIYVGGHVPWQLKYSTHNDMGKHVNLEIEEIWASVCSVYNIVSDADAAQPCWLTNGSLYREYPKPKQYPNNRKSNEGITYDPNTVYLILYVGDYDGSAWFKGGIRSLWDAKGRGDRPMMWNFDPNLVDRTAPMFDYMYDHMTEHDYFTTGNSGAGNHEPSALFKHLRPHREMPDNGQSWVNWCKPYYEQFNMDITGMVYGMKNLDPALLNLYEQFSPGGVFHSEDGDEHIAVKYRDTLFLYSDPHAVSYTCFFTLEERIDRLFSRLDHNLELGYNFGAFRTVTYSYAELVELQDAVIAAAKERDPSRNYIWADPYTLFDAVKQHGKFSKIVEDQEG